MSSDKPMNDAWASEAQPHIDGNEGLLSTERIQSVMTSRGLGPYSFTHLFYRDAARLHSGAVTHNCQGLQSRIPDRPLTDEELGAMVEHWSASANIALSARPIILAATLGIWLRGWARFRFPFWQPKWVKTSPNVFPRLDMPWLHGTAAGCAWHLARFSAYYFAGNWLVKPFIFSYATLTAVAKVSGDPRLKEALKESMRDDPRAQQAINRLQRQTGRIPTKFPPQGKEGTSGEDWEDDDGQSPIARSTDTQWDRPQQDAATTQQTRTWGVRAPPPSPPLPPQQEALPPSQNAAWGDDPIIDELDDASPIAPAARAQEVRRHAQPQRRQPPAQPDDGVSAWDRLREQAQASRNDDSKR